jgi:hypothetical protein
MKEGISTIQVITLGRFYDRKLLVEAVLVNTKILN